MWKEEETQWDFKGMPHTFLLFNFYQVGHCGEGEQKEILNYLPSTLKLGTKGRVWTDTSYTYTDIFLDLQ